MTGQGPAKSLKELQDELSSAILAVVPPDGFQDTRAWTYRTLVRNNLDAVVADFLPRTAARLGARFDDEVARFYEQRGPRTHYLRDVPAELVAHVGARWSSDDGIPAYLHDLARHELLSFEIAAAPVDRLPPALGDLSLDEIVVLGSGVTVARYRFAVHELPFGTEDRSVPEERNVTLLAYRDAEHEPRFLDLSPSANAIVEALLAGKPLADALRHAAEATGVPFDDAFLVGAAELLADLGERGVVLGAPLDPSPPA